MGSDLSWLTAKPSAPGLSSLLFKGTSPFVSMSAVESEACFHLIGFHLGIDCSEVCVRSVVFAKLLATAESFDFMPSRTGEASSTCFDFNLIGISPGSQISSRPAPRVRFLSLNDRPSSVLSAYTSAGRFRFTAPSRMPSFVSSPSSFAPGKGGGGGATTSHSPTTPCVRRRSSSAFKRSSSGSV